MTMVMMMMMIMSVIILADCDGCMAKWNDSTCWNKVHTGLIYVYLYVKDAACKLWFWQVNFSLC